MNEHMLSRGKRLGNGKWVEGYYVEYANGAKIKVTQSKKLCEIDEWWVDPATVGRCTGLRDKNGKLIWEGDKIVDGLSRAGVITWVDKYAGFYSVFTAEGKSIHKMSALSSTALLPENIAVIGNIHDNPELLEVGECI